MIIIYVKCSLNANKMLRLFLICLLFSFKLAASQEIKITGRITDNQNRSIENASVSLLDSDDNIVAYTFSDEKGNYKITYNYSETILRLKVSGLEIKPQVTYINTKTDIVQDFIIEENFTNIKEVLIESKKIKNNLDTTSIKVAPFANKTEQTLEDILKKLPGIEITKEGTIKAHGKNIDKLLIEGEDLFDKNYKLLSKNLDAKVLDEVQIIDNFDDNPILKKLNNSDKVALNIKMKKGLRNVWFGNATLGSAVFPEKRWKESLNIGLLRKKIKLFYFGDYNNLGEKSTDMISSNIMENSTFGEDRYEYKAKNVVNINSNEIQFFSKTQSVFNNALLNSLSFTTKSKSNLSLRGVTYLADDKQTQNSLSFTKYNLENNPTNFSENNNYKSKKTLASSEIELKYYPDDKNYLTNLFIFKDNPSNFSNDMLFDNTGINQNSNNKNFSFYNHLNHTYQISPSKVLNNYFYFGKDNLNEKVNIFSPFLNSFLKAGENAIVNQNTKSQIIYAGYKAKLISKFKKLDITNSFQLDYSKESMNTFLFEDNIQNTDYQNITQIKQFKLSSNNTARYNISKKIDVTTSIDFQNISFKNNNLNSNIFFVNPSIYFNVKKTGFGNFSLSYTENSTLPEINQLTNNYQLTDYRTFAKGTNYTKPLKTNTTTFTYYFYNDEKRYSFDTNLSYIKSKSIINSESSLTNDFVFNTYILSNGGESYNFNFSIVNYFRKLKLASKIENNNSWSTTPINANSIQFSNSKNTIHTIKYSATTYFKSKINLDFGFSFNFYTSDFQQITTKNYTKDAFININYKFSDTILAEANNFLFQVNKHYYSFNNIIISYVPLQSKFSYRLIFNNILNEDQYTNITLNNYTSITSTTKLIPRYLLITVKYRF